MDPELSDEAYLDELFELASERLAAGESVVPEELSAARPHLRAAVNEVLRLAAQLRAQRGDALPAVPGYELVRELGRGAMGTVYLARQLALGGRLVALKVLPPPFGASARTRQRFQAEARALARLHHQSVVAVHDVVQSGDVLAYAMEWIEGRTLAQVIAQTHGKDLAEVRRFLGADDLPDESVLRFHLRVAASIARALTEVHRVELLHRDVKPSNILIRKDGAALLSDFGLARLAESPLQTRTGVFLGTPAYSAPEQLEGRHADVGARTDVYGLGASLYHALSGALPFPGGSPTEILRRIQEGFVRPLRKLEARLPRDVETIVGKAMHPEPERRYASASALAEDLERYLADRPILARPPSAAYQFAKLVKRHRAPFALLGVVLAGLLGFAITMAVLQGRIREQAERISTQADTIREERDQALAARREAEIEADNARREARTSSRVSAFLEDMLAAANPYEQGPEVRMKEVLDAASERVTAVLGEEPEELAAARFAIGRSYTSLELTEQAEPHLQAALETFRRSGSGSERLAACLESLAELYCQTDRLAQAEPLFREALALRRALFGERSLEAAGSLRGLSNWHFLRNELGEAEDLLREALEYCAEHGEGAELAEAPLLERLAGILLMRADFAGAEPLLRAAVELYSAELGHGSAWAVAQSALAVQLGAIGRFEEAEELCRESISTLRARLGPDHPGLAFEFSRLAVVLEAGGALEEAEAPAREAVAILRRAPNAQPRELAVALSMLGHMLYGLGRNAEAESELSDAAEIARAELPADHPVRSFILSELGAVRIDLGALPAAVELLREAIASQRRAEQPGPELASSLYHLGRALLEQGELQAAAEAEVDALAHYRGFLPEEHRNIALAEVVLAEAWIGLDRLDDAEAALLERLALLDAQPGVDRDVLANVLRDLVDLYEAWDRPDDVLKFRVRLR